METSLSRLWLRVRVFRREKALPTASGLFVNLFLKLRIAAIYQMRLTIFEAECILLIS